MLDEGLVDRIVLEERLVLSAALVLDEEGLVLNEALVLDEGLVDRLVLDERLVLSAALVLDEGGIVLSEALVLDDGLVAWSDGSEGLASVYLESHIHALTQGYGICVCDSRYTDASPSESRHVYMTQDTQMPVPPS